MAIDMCKARDYVYRSGTLFERALFAWLFDAGSLERLHQIILCYKNPDAGFGHGFEHDLKAPQSNSLALEYLLGVMKHTSIPPGRASRRRRRLGRKPDGRHRQAAQSARNPRLSLGALVAGVGWADYA